MAISTIRRLAACIMKIGENRVRIKPDGIKDAESAMTRADVRDLIKKGIVSRVPVKGRRKKEPRRYRGRGKRKGSGSRNRKEEWMQKVRSQRKMLAALLEEGAVAKEHKRALYLKIKSGTFRNKKGFLAYLKENKYVNADYEPKKAAYRPKERKAKPSAKKAGKKEEKKGDSK